MLMTCTRCGTLFNAQNLDWMSDDLLKRYAEDIVCGDCSKQAERSAAAKREQMEIDERRRRLMDDYAQRIADSQLDTYAISYNDEFPSANRELMRWTMRHIDECVWIVGETGKCKTRVIQAAAREAARDRTVRYWPVSDLAARLLETAKRPEATLWDCYRAGLLILDDLGKESLTAARVAAIEAIVDHRYMGWDQACNKQHTNSPTFGLFTYTQTIGGQIWITSQVEPEIVVQRLSAVNQADAAAIVRRLSEMCVLHRC